LINFAQYAGYVNISSTKHMFYWFVESQRSPSTVRLVSSPSPPKDRKEEKRRKKEEEEGGEKTDKRTVHRIL